MEAMKDDVNRREYDFGENADIVPPEDPAFDAWIAKVAPKLNAPGSVPRGEMWRSIQAARDMANQARSGALPGVTPLRRSWRLMSVIAAALLLGVAIDRMALRKTRLRAPVANAPAPSESGDPARLYRLAAAQTLTQAEALLTSYRAAPRRDAAELQQLGRWGREVLSGTRLLIDSPAGNDPRLRALFDDLEVVLVQIIQLSGAQLDTSEKALIDRALESKDILPRIRTAVPVGVADASSSSDN
jgi:hypothetical protein